MSNFSLSPMNNPTFPDKHTVQFKRSFPITKEALWKAISAEESLSQWFMETDMEPRQDGRYSFKEGWDGWIATWKEGQCIQFNSSNDSWTRFEIIESGEHVVFQLTDRLKSDLVFEDQSLSMNIQPGGPGTHSLGLLAGWHDFVDALDDYLHQRPIQNNFEVYIEQYKAWLG